MATVSGSILPNANSLFLLFFGDMIFSGLFYNRGIDFSLIGDIKKNFDDGEES